MYADEVIVVDDGSDDATPFIAENLGVHLVRHEHNKGKAEALKTGFGEAIKKDPSIVLTIYANGDHDPADIPKIINPVLRSEADAVCGCYSTKSSSPQGEISPEEMYSFHNNSGFCAYTKKVFQRFRFEEGDEIEEEMLKEASAMGCRIRCINIDKNNINMCLLDKYLIGVVVPAYNEEKLIKTTIEGIPSYVDRIYVVNDASTDNTAKVLESLSEPKMAVITHEVNKGVGAALISGYKRALKEGMEIVAVMAGDNQMNPAQLPKLLFPIIEGRADYTKGNRLLSTEFRGGMSPWRKLGNSLLTMLTKISSGYWHIMDPQNGYTAISREALMGIDLDKIYTYYGYCNHMLIRLNAFGFRTLDVVMPARYGNEKSTIKYGPYMVKVSLMLFRNFLWRLKMKYVILSFHPLVLFYAMSMIMVPLGVLFGLYIVAKKLMDLQVSTNYPLLDVLILISGLQFLLFAMLFDMQESDKDMRGGDRTFGEY